MQRISRATPLFRWRQYQRALISSASSASLTSRSGHNIHIQNVNFCTSDAQSSLSSSTHWQSSIHLTQLNSTSNGLKQQYFSSLAEDWDGDDDDIENDHNQPPPPPKLISLLPTKHSRNLPPPVCPPSHLRSEVESIFDAPVGSLIVYNTKSSSSSSDLLKTVEEEMNDAYYASDEIVQRVEYIMRGLNSQISKDSFVSKSLKHGVMEYDDVDNDDANNVSSSSDILGKEECFRAMIDLIKRMSAEGDTYEELRTRVRSQVLDPSSSAEEGSDSSSSSSDSSSSDSDNEGGGAGLDMDEGDKSFNKWEEEMTENMNNSVFGKKMAASTNNEEEDDIGMSPEEYQFGANPGVTTHMYDLVLDSLACLCHEQYNTKDYTDLVDLMPEDEGSPPEFAKTMLETVLSRHWMDGGDIGLGNEGTDSPMGRVGEGIGVGAGTGAGSLAKLDLFSRNFDVRTCPTPMTFNTVLRITANFDPVAYAEAMENAKVLGGDMGNESTSTFNSNSDQMKQEKERLRDVTINAALTTYSSMYDCVALTLRTFKNSTKLATSRSALKRQAKLLKEKVQGKRRNDVISGRNSATYAYLIQTIGNCTPPSLSRGNMVFALYHKGCVEEGIMDENVVKAMRCVGGYGDDDDELGDIEDGDEALPPAPSVSNGQLFDSYLQKELGRGVTMALEKGRNLRQDRNYKLRRHVDWDDTY